MIAYLEGKILNKNNNYLIIKVEGIGYKVFVNNTIFAESSNGVEVSFYIHQHISETAQDLYGFNTMDDLQLFDILLSVSGVGPKSALGVLDVASGDDIKEAILSENPDLLTKVSGIGKRTAERIVVELKTKIAKISQGLNLNGVGGTNSDEIDALMVLGYSMQQAREALRQVDKEIKDSGERIKAALKVMGR